MAGGYPLLWASMASTQSVPLTVIQEACDLDAVSCPQLLELLTPGSPGLGTGGPTSAPGLLAPGLGGSSCQHRPPAPPAKSGFQSTGLGAPVGILMLCLISSLLEADLEIMSLLKQGHVLLS